MNCQCMIERGAAAPLSMLVRILFADVADNV